MTLLGLLKGKVTFEAIHDWMGANSDNKLFLNILNKKEKLDIPSESTLHRILINVDNNELEAIFREYFKVYAIGEHIAVDGKWLNGSDVNGQYTQVKHKSVFNILNKGAGIVIGHYCIGDDKKSEIPVFRAALEDKALFCQEGQIFSFDALMTQSDILNKINKDKNYYIAKLKNNQKLLKNKALETIQTFETPTYSNTEDGYKTEGNKQVSRKVEVFQSTSSDIVMFDSKFDNIQSIIKVTKTTTNPITGEVKESMQLSIANFKEEAIAFGVMILKHWRVETYHYHMDMLMHEDRHIAYINPFSISILRSFALNLYQIFFNKHKGEKIVVDNKQTKKPLIMARVKRYSEDSDEFMLELLEPS